MLTGAKVADRVWTLDIGMLAKRFFETMDWKCGAPVIVPILPQNGLPSALLARRCDEKVIFRPL